MTLREKVSQALFDLGTPIHAFDSYHATMRYREAQADAVIAVVVAFVADRDVLPSASPDSDTASPTPAAYPRHQPRIQPSHERGNPS